MPRTKQIHPRNLRDKIEEAQKELNGAEVSKTEILEAGVKGASESLKGVKRKKIVVENHLKKIPKSPLRNPLQTKHKPNTEVSSLAALQSTPKAQEKHSSVPVKNGKQLTKQNGDTPGVVAAAMKSEDPVSPKKPSFLSHPAELRRWRSEGSDPTRLSVLEEKQPWSSSPSAPRTDGSECIPPPPPPPPPRPHPRPHCSTSSPSYTNTAFDVLLKAMEPELSTLSQKGSSCAITTENLRPNKTVGSPSTLKNSSMDAPGHSSQELVDESQCSPGTSFPVPVAATQKDEPTAGLPVSQQHHPREQFVSTPSQHDQQPSGHLAFTGSLTNLQTQEKANLEQIYNTVVASTIGLTSPSNRTQVVPSPKQQVESAFPVSVSPANPTQSPPGLLCSPAPVASVVSQNVEQMCSLLRDQKPKKPGKYICEYCSRACAKPSVLLKHIRSHTGERPYPCVTCGFSFKTKSNLYKHKKSHAHTIKLGLVLQPDAGGLFLAQESPKALSVHSDVEDSGESEEEGSSDGRQNDPAAMALRPVQIMKKLSNPEALSQSGSLPSNPAHVAVGFLPQDRPSESETVTELPKVVVHPVNMSPFRTDSSKGFSPKPDAASAQGPKDLQLASTLSHSAAAAGASLETEEKSLRKGDSGDSGQPEGNPDPDPHGGPVAHAQLQRQQATDDSQEQQGKLLSPRSLGSTDSGYFSRSESADQAVSPPTPFARNVPTTDPDSAKNSAPPAPRVSTPTPSTLSMGEKLSVSPGQMRPPLATKTLEERISKLISDNEALVDDKQLDSVKPRRTSLSRRGSIDSPKSYIFKDSFQFDLKPMGRRTSSSSDIPKSPFTPPEKSTQVFLLSVPSLDCLPITRSNSMPTTGCSAVPPNIIPPPHPLRGSQSFDDKIGTLYDDVFVSGPNPSVPHSGHPRPLVRQAAVEDPSASEPHTVGAGSPVDEACQGCPGSSEPGPGRSRPAAQTSHLEKKKSHQGRGTMFECETCRNRYRKLENFENHKKFYCSELHGPKTKVAVREPEPSPAPTGTQSQVLHYRVAGPAGVWEQTPQIRKRRKMKSVGDDEDLQPRESRTSKSAEAPQLQPALGCAPSPCLHPAALASEQPRTDMQGHSAQAPPVARGAKQVPMVEQQLGLAAQDKLEGKRQGSGISVIQHTNSLSRPSSFDKSEPFEGGSMVSFQELRRAGKHEALKVIGISPEEGHPPRDAPHSHQSSLSDSLQGELQESSRMSTRERNMLGQPSRLVRQHNIQVPEILVTEEPDQEAQGHDEDKAEKFSWPQRSETLSKLPTEKLPPKKKRLRLAEMEHSSTESSFDSTLSWSPSRESSLSHTSSFSASLDIEDTSKTEASPKIDFPNRTEFLLIPPGSNTLSIPGSHREMRRAASEQISCVPTLMEVSDVRSKSFDCGSMTPPRATALSESQPFTSPSGVGVTGHVPLLERRRGPLIRQISLNIAPDSQVPPLHTSPFQNVTLPNVKAGPPQGPQLPNTSLAGFGAHTLQSWTQTTDLHVERSSPGSATSFPPQQPLGTSLLNQAPAPLSHQNLQPPLQVSALGIREDAHSAVCVSCAGAVEDCFPPKYQLHCHIPPSGQAGSANPLRPLPNPVLPDPAAADPSPAPGVLPAAKAGDPVAGSTTLAPLQPGLPVNQLWKEPASFVLPTHLQTKGPTYCFATSLPQILVTQDLSNTPICQTNQSPVPISEEQDPMPALPEDPQNALLTPEKDLTCKKVPSDMSQHSPVSKSLPIIQKPSVGRLSPQQESSASSKRMLSPANSLDIAMEKHQKRAKDDHGAVCAPHIPPSEPLHSRASDGQRQKKPVLVRQLCTTEPLEGGVSEQDDFSQSVTSSQTATLTEVLSAGNLSSGQSRFVVTEPISELQEFENSPPKSLTVTVGNSHVSLENAHVSPLESIGNNQDRKSPGIKHQGDKINIKGQSPPPTSGLSLLSNSDPHQPSFPSLKTATSFTWCYLLRQKSLPLPQNDQKTSAYTEWTVSSSNPNPLDLPTKVALSLLNSKQRTGKPLYCEAITTHSKSDLLVYSSKWKNSLSKRALGNEKPTVVEFSNEDASEISSERDKENSLIQSEPRRIKIFDGGYKSNEEYVYVRGRGRGKYICEECGIRCKKPSMLKKHIRTHTDVRPYHCTYCNFSFKTKGNLTKHMKSKAHSKKCVDLGISVGLIDEQDTEESDEKQRFGSERSGYDLEESDGPDEDDNEDDDEDSQADSGLSAAPSVTASPQHLPSTSGLQDPGSAEEDLRVPEYFSGVHTDPMDILPRALLTKMTVLSTVQSDPHKRTNSPAKTRQRAVGGQAEAVPSVDASGSLEAAARAPCAPTPVDHAESEALRGAAAQDIPCVRLPSAGAHHSPQPAAAIQSAASPPPDSQAGKLQTPSHPPPGLPSSQTRLFSHLPLHSQQQSRTPYNMVPVGGIHMVPAGLTYSTFVPIQAGPVQLTIPAVSVFHRAVGTPGPGDAVPNISGTANPEGVAELSSVVPCIPIGQIRVPGLPNLCSPDLQSLTSLGMETVNIVGLASANLSPQVHPPGLALNAVGLQVLTGAPAQSSPSLQILNIALPTLIPSVSQVPVGPPGPPETAAARSKAETPLQPQQSQASSTESPHCAPDGQQENTPGPAGEGARLEGPSKMDAARATCAGQGMSAPEATAAQAQPTSSPEAPRKATPSDPQIVPTDRTPRPTPRQPTVHFSDVSSDDDEDRLVIAT